MNNTKLRLRLKDYISVLESQPINASEKWRKVVVYKNMLNYIPQLEQLYPFKDGLPMKSDEDGFDELKSKMLISDATYHDYDETILKKIYGLDGIIMVNGQVIAKKPFGANWKLIIEKMDDIKIFEFNVEWLV